MVWSCRARWNWPIEAVLRPALLNQSAEEAEKTREIDSFG
ncbi:hypothetical protein SynBIOSE41_01050 [Synechococcus sp. BIOS-E4-1]|nr:hypothetical protein SynBIOSE41_01050 [Synechococcus sp. BIOS-E4-1]